MLSSFPYVAAFFKIQMNQCVKIERVMQLVAIGYLFKYN